MTSHRLSFCYGLDVATVMSRFARNGRLPSQYAFTGTNLPNLEPLLVLARHHNLIGALHSPAPRR